MTTLIGVVGVALTIAAALLLVPAGVFFVETVLARRREVVPSAAMAGPRPRVAVLVPAHDEAGGIGAALATILPQLADGDRLLVVADNCTDETARVAAAAGAEAIRRDDPERRGKGYALDFGVRHLRADPAEAVVIVDADCVLHPGSLDRLVRLCIAAGRPVQSLYLMRPPTAAALPTRIAELAWAIKNLVRPLGALRISVPCQLMGTGMAFPWPVIERAPLASGHLVEDMCLGLDLAAAGTPPLFCPEALVTSYFAATTAGLGAQRTRWEHGHLGVIVERAPRLLWQAIRTRDVALAAMVLDLCVPPLAALVLLLLAGALVAGALLAAGGMAAPLILCALGLVLVAAGVTVAWRRFGREIVSPRELIGVPGYVLAKLPLYWRALRRRQARWIRTDRDDVAPK
jgi:cellulose synthase/poly-beta-1,6-N-acetylglucosamine synthase-like glycosyltransferase